MVPLGLKQPDLNTARRSNVGFGATNAALCVGGSGNPAAYLANNRKMERNFLD